MAGAMIDLDIGDLRSRLAQVAEQANRMADDRVRRQLLDRVGGELESQTVERFATKRAPDGEKWADWSPHYRPSAGSLLQRASDLRGDISHQIDGDELEVGAPTKYAAVHQYGHTFENAWGRGITATVPARPYLGLSDEDAEDLGMTIDGFVREYLAA